MKHENRTNSLAAIKLRVQSYNGGVQLIHRQYITIQSRRESAPVSFCARPHYIIIPPTPRAVAQVQITNRFIHGRLPTHLLFLLTQIIFGFELCGFFLSDR